MQRTRICSFELDPRGFVHARLDPQAYMQLEDAREALEMTWKVAGERRRPVLVDMTHLRGESRAARQYFVSEEAVEKYSAVAIVVGSPVSRVIGSFFLRLGDHKAPTKLFGDEQTAVRWVVARVE
jgi:hypothetical protein